METNLVKVASKSLVKVGAVLLIFVGKRMLLVIESSVRTPSYADCSTSYLHYLFHTSIYYIVVYILFH